jgi:hypothetical protein
VLAGGRIDDRRPEAVRGFGRERCGAEHHCGRGGAEGSTKVGHVDLTK